MALAIALFISIFAAVVPTAAYCAVFDRADRYEREPRALLVVAFVWGALPAVILSLISEIALGSPFISDGGSLQAALVEGVVIAPIVEEIAKGIALLGLFVWSRSEFDGALDGLVYGALVGFGFAMTENFMYFVGAYDQGGFGNLTWLIAVRSVIFGLNHAFYTSLTGIGLGLARNQRNVAARLALAGLGLSAAILVHSLHNLGVLVVDITPLGVLLSLLIAGAGLALIVAAVILSWRHERWVMQSELSEEVGVILSAHELMELTGRWRQPIRRRSDDRSERMALFAELAVRKRRLRMLGTAYEGELLDEIESIRARLHELTQAQFAGPVATGPASDDPT